MNKNTRIVAVAACACTFLLALTLCACTARSTSSSAASAAPSGGLPADSATVTVLLDYSAGTGYEWVVASNPDDVVAEVARETVSTSGEQGEIAGGPLQDKISFRAVRPGEAEVVCTLERPWEDPADEAEKQVFYLVVDDNLRISVDADKSNYKNEPEYA